MAEPGRSLDLTARSRGNAILAWVLIGFLGVVAGGSLLSGDVLWAGFAVVVAILALVPTIVHRDLWVALPWEALVLAALPIIGRALAAESLLGAFATYLSVAAIALILAIELDTFGNVRMSSRFAIFFVVVATMATAGVWAVVRWSLDVLFGTTFLLDPVLSEGTIHDELMWEFVYSTAAGILGGLTFEGYFRRRGSLSVRAGLKRPRNNR